MSDAAPQVLLVDDEQAIARVLHKALTAAGYRIAIAETGAQALSVVARNAPELIVLDLGLPDMDGKDVIAALREWTEAPILVLSARHDEAERIAALDVGADDFVTKPFHMGELQARLRAALRHQARRRAESTEYSCRDLSIDFIKRRVTVYGEEVKLTRKEYDLLRTLAQHAGQVVTHKQLLAAGWGATVTDTQFVRVYVGQLRQKIEEDPSAPKLILTEPGIGYRLQDE
ncbi:DNA-binding response regulator (plasmid) [Methylosinus sp. C49]|uniref:response regulator n=1 Tax=unclassified Methylosinus TaxID=2624500 RepID=UPI001366DC60|nr:response regulator transcription factor [Methylosinus sp. C49]MBU3888512.1 response regulator transcription factor [Methylosinus sp. KRF6]BBU64294.1 DNA-binding response regulator [Methylosinus sp. C49]